jgi:hypothetical protein
MIDRCRETPFIGHVAPSRICICSTTISSLAPWKTPSCVNNDITAPQLPTASSSCLFLFFFFIRTHTGTSNEDAFHFFFHYSFRTTSPLALSHSHTCYRQLFTRPRLSRNPRYPLTNLHKPSPVERGAIVSLYLHRKSEILHIRGFILLVSDLFWRDIKSHHLSRSICRQRHSTVAH